MRWLLLLLCSSVSAQEVKVLLVDHGRTQQQVFSWNGTALNSIVSFDTSSPAHSGLRGIAASYGFITNSNDNNVMAAIGLDGSILEWPCADPGSGIFDSARGRDAAMADYNGDGITDCGERDGDIWLYPPSDYDQLPQDNLYASLGEEPLTAGDFDGDGDKDILTRTQFWRNDGGGTFTAMGSNITFPSNPGGIGPKHATSPDWDGDGDDDLLVAFGQDFVTGGQIEAYRVDSGFQLVQLVSTSTGLDAVTMTGQVGYADFEQITPDFNGDGCGDMVHSEEYIVWLSNCDGTWTQDQFLSTFTSGNSGKHSIKARHIGSGDYLICWTNNAQMECSRRTQGGTYSSVTVAAHSSSLNLHALIIYSDADEVALPAAPLTGVVPPLLVGNRHAFIDKQLLRVHTSLAVDSTYTDCRANNPTTNDCWLYDRVQFFYEKYLTNGDAATLAEAQASAIEYLAGFNDVGSNPGFPDCLGGWEGASANKCDRKYTYASACWYRLAVDGVQACDATRLERLRAYAMGPAWDADWLLSDTSNRDTLNLTERHIGYGLMTLVYVYKTAQAQGMTTVEAAAKANIEAVIEWLYDWQAAETYGGWMHSYNGHEGAGTPGVNDYLMFSPWQSAIITGALWRAWEAGIKQKTCGPADDQWCIPVMAVKFAQALEDHGYMTDAESAATRRPWNQTDISVWYINTPEDLAEQDTIQSSEGTGSDTHIPEVMCATAMGHYFAGLGGASAGQKAAFSARWDQLLPFFNLDGGNQDMASDTIMPPRGVSWQHSHNPSCEFLIQ